MKIYAVVAVNLGDYASDEIKLFVKYPDAETYAKEANEDSFGDFEYVVREKEVVE